MRRGQRAPGSGREGALGRAGRLATGSPRWIVGIWALVMAALALQGFGLEERLAMNPLYAEGSLTQQQHEIALREFGSEDAMIVMLRGPRAQVDRQGRELARQLESLPRSMVVSPWTPGRAIEGLRPKPEVAALIISLAHRPNERYTEVGIPVEEKLQELVTAPVRADIAGAPAYAHALQGALKRAAAIGERLAIPVMLIVLLFVFRSLVAAAIPAVVGGVVVAATRGIVGILSGFISIDVFAIGAVSMLGLALGVDYSLLVVSRFREEIKRNEDVGDAVRTTVLATGRSVGPAAIGLIVAVLVAALVVPSAVVVSTSIAIIIATALSAVAALLIVPAFLMLLGAGVDRWSLPARRPAASSRRSRWVANRPWVALPILFVLFVVSGLAFTLDTGIASFSLLPPGNSGRTQSEAIQRELGPGWTSPTEIIMDGGSDPVTTPERLHALADFQRRVERDPGVQTMAGFVALEKGTDQLEGFEQGLIDQERGLVRLHTGLSRVHSGASLNTSGLLAAADGARRLDAGLGATESGSGALAGGLQRASEGSVRLSDGLVRASDGSGRLAEGTAKASTGAGRLAHALAQAEESSAQASGSANLIKNAMRSGEAELEELHSPLHNAEEQLDAARQALLRMAAGRADPEYSTALRAVEEAIENLTGNDPATGEPTDSSYEGVDRGVEDATGQFDLGLYLAEKVDQNADKGAEGSRKLARASARLDRGLSRLAAASNRVSEGVAQLSDGGRELSPGLEQLSDGAVRLTAGLNTLQAGSGRLAGGLGGGAQRSKLLGGAVGKIDSGLERRLGGDSGTTGLDQMREQSPGLFRSGYFYLAALDGSRPRQRDQAGFLVNLDRGGQAARMLIIPTHAPDTAQADEVTDRLQRDADALAKETGTSVLVGGFGPSQRDVDSAFRDQAPWTRLALSIVTFLILIPVVRSLVLPLLAALINVLVVTASFGLLALLFNGSLLGGPGYVDTGVLPATMVVIFGLAIDYEVFIFARIREEYLRTGSTRTAIANGLERTGGVVTGAAIIMIAVFLSFAASSLLLFRNFGVAQAIAVFIDAFIVRLVVVPSIMRALGDRCWWIPRWLDRLLPGDGSPVVSEVKA